MKRFLAVLAFLAMAVPALAREGEVKIKHEKEFCKAFDCSQVVFARHANPKKDKKFYKAFHGDDVVFARQPKAKFVQKKEK